MAGSLQVRVLGPVQVTADGREITPARPLERALLVRLALADGPVLDQTLARALWDEEHPPRLAARLRVIASRLRAGLGDHAKALTRTAAGYALDAQVIDLDAAKAAIPRTSGDPNAVHELTRTTLTLWRGESLADLRNLPYFEDEGARLDSLQLDLQIAWIESGLAINAAGVRTDLERLTRQHPFNERLTQLSALDLYRAGRQADALKRFAQLRKALTDEFQATPHSATTELELQVLRQDPELLVPTAPRRTRKSLLPPQTAFVGREIEQAEVQRKLSRPALVTLVGGPGVGKTRLARESAATVQETGRSVAWLDLAPLRPADDLVAALVTALGLEAGSDPVARCAEFLTGSLLVLDNAEHLVDQVADLLRALQNHDITFLVTSQLPVRLHDEQVHQLSPLPLPDAITLFCERTGTPPGPAAEAICTAVDRLPLGIELAAGLTRTLTVEQLAQRIDDRLRLLVGGRRDAGSRHTSLLAALDWSHELLDHPTRTAFRRLAVFTGGCTLEAAEQVVAGNGIDATEVPALLDELIDRSLLTVSQEIDGPRFHQLETVHDYAWRQLETSGDEESVRRRHLAWCVDQASNANLYGRIGHARLIREFDHEQANFRAAVRWALGPGADPAAVISIVAASRWHWWNRGMIDEAVGWLKQAMTMIPSDTVASRAEGALALAFMTHNASEYADALGYARQSLVDYEELADEHGAIAALLGLGLISLALGNHSAAIEYGELVAARAVDAGQLNAWGAGLNTIGLALRALGRREEAVDYFLRALDCWRGLSDHHGVAVVYSNLAVASRQLGRVSDARRQCLESLRLSQPMDIVDGQLDVVECWAQLEAADGRAAVAFRLLRVAARYRQLFAAPLFVTDELRDRDDTFEATRRVLGDEAADRIAEEAAGVQLKVVVQEILDSAPQYGLTQRSAP